MNRPAPRAIAVVGAGLAGIACARLLRDAGHTVEIFEKSRGIGGRLATRRIELDADGQDRHVSHAGHSISFDHGAQYFTARDSDFLEYVTHCVQSGYVARWPRHVACHTPQTGWQSQGVGAPPRYVGVDEMSNLVRPLLSDLPVHLNHRVAALERDGGGWRLRDSADHLSHRFDAVVLAIPAPQAQALARDHAATLAIDCGKIEMSPCWSLMALTTALPIEFDAAFIQSGPLAWLAHNSSKPGRAVPEGQMSWVAHATPSWTQHHLGTPTETVATLLARELAALLGDPDLPFLFATAHRWLYAKAVPQSVPINWHDASLQLAICGDFTHGDRIESAFISGRASAREVLGWFS